MVMCCLCSISSQRKCHIHNGDPILLLVGFSFSLWLGSGVHLCARCQLRPLSGAVFLVLILCGVQIVGWSLCGSCDLKVAQFGHFSSSSVVIAMWELFPAVCQLGILFGEFKAFLLYLSSCQLLAFVYRISSSWFRLVWAQLLCWWSQSGT
jgi:hypothetical protein